MLISSRRPNISSHWYWNRQVRSFGLCSTSKSKCFNWCLPWRRISSWVTQNWKVTDNVRERYIWAKKVLQTIFCSNNKSKDKVKLSIFIPLAMLKFSQWRHNVCASNLAYARENDNNPKYFFASKQPLERQWTTIKLCMYNRTSFTHNKSLKNLTWSQYINASTGILFKQKFQRFFFCFFFLVCQELGYMRRQFVSIHIQKPRC